MSNRLAGPHALRVGRRARGPLHRLDDLGVPRAPTEVPREGLLDLGARRARPRVEEGARREHHPRLTEAALQRAACVEGVLHRVEARGRREPRPPGSDRRARGRRRGAPCRPRSRPCRSPASSPSGRAHSATPRGASSARAPRPRPRPRSRSAGGVGRTSQPEEPFSALAVVVGLAAGARSATRRKRAAGVSHSGQRRGTGPVVR